MTVAVCISNVKEREKLEYDENLVKMIMDLNVESHDGCVKYDNIFDFWDNMENDIYADLYDNGIKCDVSVYLK